MKKIERLNNVYSQEQLLNYGMISRKVNELVNAHNELTTIVNLLLERDKENCLEKAKKKIELELSAISHTGDKDYEYHINTILGVLIELVNAHNELLDTHTVKEEDEMVRCEHGLIAGDECDCGKGYRKEEPTTPEKSMTLPDGKEVRTSYSEIFDQDGKSIEGIIAIQTFNGAIIVATANKMYCNKPEIFKTNSSFEEVATPEKREDSPRPQGEDWKEGIKPQKASYEVTCGRCEKSFKHSCGPEK